MGALFSRISSLLGWLGIFRPTTSPNASGPSDGATDQTEFATSRKRKYVTSNGFSTMDKQEESPINGHVNSANPCEDDQEKALGNFDDNLTCPIKRNEEDVIDSASNSGHASADDLNSISSSRSHSDASIRRDEVITKNVEWHGEAQTVFVTGSWVGWSDKIALNRKSGSDSLWETDIDFDVTGGNVVEMKFIVDDVWVTSPNMPTITNDVGSMNNVIYLSEEVGGR